MKILLVTETLSVGGAETFVLRLADRFAQDHEVMLLNLLPWLSHRDMVAKVSTGVAYATPDYTGRGFLNKVDSALLKLGINYSTLEQTIFRFLEEKIKSFRPDVIHSHLFKPDYYIARVQQRLARPVNHVITNHGDYLLYERTPPKRILRYPDKLRLTLRHINHFVNISEEQMGYSAALPASIRPDTHKILNGYEGRVTGSITRESLGIGPEDFVFGMVARGIPEKGWEQLAAAFNRLDRPDTKLLLVGDGPGVHALKTAGTNKNIIFAGFSDNPIDYICLFDVGLLPSYYKAESLPTVIIEYLFSGKPVIATDVGEISRMLQGDQGDAGLLVSLQQGRPDVAALVRAMSTMLDPEAYSRYAANTAAAFRKYDMDTCVAAYLQLFTTPVSGQHQQITSTTSHA